MKIKSLLLLPVTLTLVLLAAPLVPSFTGTVNAQEAHEHERGEGWEKLGLSADQKAKIKQIRQSEHTQRDAILTPQQKKLLKQARATHQRPNLNLSPDQQSKIKALHQSTESQIKALLTPAQRKQLAQLRQQRKEKH
jgi:Spy/CpxP family protein refolding chaperone